MEKLDVPDYENPFTDLLFKMLGRYKEDFLDFLTDADDEVVDKEFAESFFNQIIDGLKSFAPGDIELDMDQRRNMYLAYLRGRPG